MIRAFITSLLLFAFGASAADYVKATLTITNSTTTNDAFTVNGSTRRGAGTRTSSTWVTNTSPMVTTTNIASQLGAYRPSGVTFIDRTASNVITIEGLGLTVTASNFASLTLETNADTPKWALEFPSTAFPASVIASNGSALVPFIDASTNRIGSNSTALAHFVSLQGTQTLANKTLTAPTINSGYGTNQAIDKANLTNANMRGTSVGFNATRLLLESAKLQVDNGSYVTNTDTGEYWKFGDADTQPAHASEIADLTTYADGIDAILSATKANNTNASIRGLTVERGTNYWKGNAIYEAFQHGSIVNGDNADIPIGTNVLIRLSGASGVKNFHGFLEGYEGQKIEVVFEDGGTNWIYNSSGSEGTATRRILTGTGANVGLTNTFASAIFRYISGRWIMGERTN